MRVVQLEGSFAIDSLMLTEIPEPEAPGPGQVLVRIRAVSLNYRDLVIVQGKYAAGVAFPFVPVSDGAGTVVAVGEDITRFKPGDRVIGQYLQDWVSGELTQELRPTSIGGPRPGLLRDYVLFPEHGLVATPPHLTDEAAATLPIAAVTAWSALFTYGHLAPGETVLIQGTGGVSLFGLQLAKLAGARVIVTSSSDSKLERTTAIGADAGINYRSEPEWDKAVLALTEGRGVDHILEVGGAETIERSIRASRYGGGVYMIGFLAGMGGEINLVPAIQRHVRLQGMAVGSRTEFEAMNRAIALHGLHPVVDRVFPLEETRDAFRHMESGAHFGKVVIRLA